MTFYELLSKYGILIYAFAIFFGGRWGLKYCSYFKKTKYNFLVFATIFGGLFILGEYLAGTFVILDFGRYLLTYTAVTTCYEMLVDYLPFLKPKIKSNEN